MPRRRRAWAAWNYNIPRDAARLDGQVTLTYNMNILQGLAAAREYCVTLNNTAAIDPDKVLRVIGYEHPVFTAEAVAAQARHREIDGARRTYYCGAYWRYGFHEDGVVSARDALRHFEQDLRDQRHAIAPQRDLRRAG
jgi:predicted NAD/FAD-binding protein